MYWYGKRGTWYCMEDGGIFNLRNSNKKWDPIFVIIIIISYLVSKLKDFFCPASIIIHHRNRLDLFAWSIRSACNEYYADDNSMLVSFSI